MILKLKLKVKSIANKSYPHLKFSAFSESGVKNRGSHLKSKSCPLDDLKSDLQDQTQGHRETGYKYVKRLITPLKD